MNLDERRNSRVEDWENEDNELESVLDETLRATADEVLAQLVPDETHSTCCLFPDVDEGKLLALHRYLFAQASLRGLTFEAADEHESEFGGLPFNLPWTVEVFEG